MQLAWELYLRHLQHETQKKSAMLLRLQQIKLLAIPLWTLSELLSKTAIRAVVRIIKLTKLKSRSHLLESSWAM
jgi:hypothetical protein